MKEIILSQGATAQIDDDDYERTQAAGPWHLQVTAVGERIAVNQSDSITTALHRFVKNVVRESDKVLFKDGNGLNCQKDNLVVASQSLVQAGRAKKAGTTSQYKGVSWKEKRGKWEASIKVNGAYKFLGRFDHEQDAARAYDNAAREAFGAFALTNF